LSILDLSTPVYLHRPISFEKKRLEKDPIVQSVLETIKAKGLFDVITFEYDWCNEVIAQFYATIHPGHEEETTLYWMTNGRILSLSVSRFAEILKFEREGTTKIHQEISLSEDQIDFLYPPGVSYRGGEHKKMWIQYQYLNNIFRKTFAPKGGNHDEIHGYSRNLLQRMLPDQPKIDLADYMFQEIIINTTYHHRCCFFAPFIQYAIDAISGMTFHRETHHKTLYVSLIQGPAHPPHQIPAAGPTDAPAAPAPSGSTPTFSLSHRRGGLRRTFGDHSSGASSSRGGLSNVMGRALKAIFTMCKTNDARTRNIERRQRELFQHHGIESSIPFPGEEEEAFNFENPFDDYVFDDVDAPPQGGDGDDAQ
jgi:hypothetical protein